MPRLDLYHNTVIHALQTDGWQITHNPLILEIGEKRLYADLGADRLISAHRGIEKIAVEIKSFVAHSDVKELQYAFGQFMVYYKILAFQEPERRLYLAVTETVFRGIFSQELGQLLLADDAFHLLVFNEEKEVIVQWIPH